MEREDRRNYFIIGSVIIEIVSPMFQRQLELHYHNKGFHCLKDFLQYTTVLHLLFHLRYRNARCCKDHIHCINSGSSPLNYSQWNLMYTDTSFSTHSCYCKYTAKNIQLDDLDITLSSVILLNCCDLPPNVSDVINQLRQIKNNYLSHNSRGNINQIEYESLWSDITMLILRIDPSLENNLVILKRRPLDETLCYKYSTEISGIQIKLEEIDCKFNRMELLLIENSKKLDDSMRMNSRDRDESDEQTLNNEKKDTHTSNSSGGGPYAACSSIKQVNENRTLFNCSSREGIPNLENVQYIKELNMSVEQKKEASFTMFPPGCNVRVGTIVMGNQNITVTSIDQISETSSNSTSS